MSFEDKNVADNIVDERFQIDVVVLIDIHTTACARVLSRREAHHESLLHERIELARLHSLNECSELDLAHDKHTSLTLDKD